MHFPPHYSMNLDNYNNYGKQVSDWTWFNSTWIVVALLWYHVTTQCLKDWKHNGNQNQTTPFKTPLVNLWKMWLCLGLHWQSCRKASEGWWPRSANYSPKVTKTSHCFPSNARLHSPCYFFPASDPPLMLFLLLTQKRCSFWNSRLGWVTEERTFIMWWAGEGE